MEDDLTDIDQGMYAGVWDRIDWFISEIADDEPSRRAFAQVLISIADDIMSLKEVSEIGEEED